MSLRKLHIFTDPTAGFDAGINPYRDLLAEHPDLPLLFGPALEGRKGTWKQLAQEKSPHFTPETSPVILEIGSHLGHVLLGLAEAFPAWFCLGIDLTFKRVVKTAQKAVREGVPNVLSLLGNAHHIPDLFAPGELGGILAFFPDPWNQKRHQKKNRLFSGPYCASLHALIQPGGFFWVKTDDESYHAEFEAHLAQAGFARAPLPMAFQEDVTRYRSIFEQRFQGKGLPTYESYWVKKP